MLQLRRLGQIEHIALVGKGRIAHRALMENFKKRDHLKDLSILKG
jgi:hypothetical protein